MRPPLPFRVIMSSLLVVSALMAPSAARAAAAPVEFDSPKGKFHVVVAAGDREGSDLTPLALTLTPAAGGAPLFVRAQMAGYTAPDADRAARLLHFSADESAVAIDNPPNVAAFGYRLVPLAKQAWKVTDVEGEGAEWADENRLVFRGQASDAFYIGVFDARTGKLHKADPSLSMYTDFELVHVSPTTLVFREEDTANRVERCLSFDTVKAKRRIGPCPGS